MEHTDESLIDYLVSAWQIQVNRGANLINKLTNEQLATQIAPGRNTGIYLLGHLTAIHDAMLPLLDIGKSLYPELEEVFVKNPDSSDLVKPTVGDLRIYWTEVNKTLNEAIFKFTVAEWLDRHSAISADDFQREPHRNKINVLLSRTTHLANHLGQLALLKAKQ
ncbi:MAG TPA: DinB family protein [Mucilaginibacter sp.]|jgi:hypothetical protein